MWKSIEIHVQDYEYADIDPQLLSVELRVANRGSLFERIYVWGMHPLESFLILPFVKKNHRSRGLLLL